MSLSIRAESRPFLLTFKGSTRVFRFSSAEAQACIDGAAGIVSATPNRVQFKVAGATDGVLVPATLGGGPAFNITRGR